MKKIILLGLVAMLVLGVAAYVYAAAGSAKISNNGPHDINAQISLTTAGIDEPCAYCHIPHKAATSDGVPLRNRAGGSSDFCMTCHDSTDSGATGAGGGVIRSPRSGNLAAGTVASTDTFLLSDHTIGGTGHIVGDQGAPYTIAWGTDTKNVLVADESIALGKMNSNGNRKTLATGSLTTLNCQSCHDVHNYTTDTAPFLRRSNAGSGLCTSCHDL